MKHKLLTLLLTLALVGSVFGQAGVGPQGKRYVNYKDSYVDFGTFAISGGVTTGTLAGFQHTTTSLTAAQIIAMYTTPVQLIPAPGAGHSIAVAKVNFAITRTATAFTGGGAAIIQYDSTANGAGTQACDSTLASTVITGAAGLSNSLRNGAVISDSAALDNKGLYISNATAVFAAGTGTAVVDVWYYLN